MHTAPREVVLYTRAHCSLCEEARILLDRVRERHGLAVREVDVDADPALAQRYGDAVPVALLGARELFRLQATLPALERALHDART